MDSELHRLIVEECAREHYASRCYQQIATLANREGLFGIEKFFLAAAKEELEHEQAFIELANDFGDYVKLDNIHDPRDYWADPKEMFQFALDMEIAVDGFISGIMAKAQELKDYKIFTFFIPYANEQRTAIAEIKDILSRYDKFGGLYQFDRWVGELVK